MSSWGLKLQKKLIALADGASKESMQTLANWVSFNRKHAAVFAQTFRDFILGSTSEARQWLYWQVLSEVLFASQDDAEKWDRAADLRSTLGESAVIPALEGLGSRAMTDQIEELWKQWDNNNVFGGPTLIGQIRRLLASSRSAPSKDDPVPASGAAHDSSSPLKPMEPSTLEADIKDESTSDAPKEEEKVAGDISAANEDTNSAAARRGSLSSVGSGKQRRSSVSSFTGVEIDYDFESKNIPFGIVDSREFLDPCRAVATLQIARDVRNDTPVQLNSMLSNLPEDIADMAKSIEEGQTSIDDLDKATIRDYSIRIPAKLLELDLDEQFQTMKTFQDIIRQQQAAREKLILLLIKSRCRFGSDEAAEQFLKLQKTSEQLKKRKQFLVDALELEGLDTELDTTDFEKSLEDLPPLTWYNPDSSVNDAKRHRVD